MTETIRIGCGAGFSSDRLGPAVDLAQRGALEYLVFECIGERTMAFGHRDRMLDATRGYNPQLGARMRAVLAHCRANGTRIITNLGVANPRAAAALTVSIEKLTTNSPVPGSVQRSQRQAIPNGSPEARPNNQRTALPDS